MQLIHGGKLEKVEPIANHGEESVSTSLTYATWRKQEGWKPLKIVDAEGVNFIDSSGRKYLDLSSQLMCSNLGHKNMNIIRAIKNQAEKIAYIAPGFNTEVREELSSSLKTILPANLNKYFFATSGTEANEAAVKIIRMYKRKEGNTKIISAYNSYHGSTGSSIQVTGDFRRIEIDDVQHSPGFLHIPQPYCYRCPFGLKYPSCNVACADYVEYVIKSEGHVGGIILEPVTGTNGVIVPPKEYLPRVSEIARDNDVVFVADEVMTGFGRTGDWFAVNHWNVKPDIITTAKGISGAYMPLSLTATDKRISEYFDQNYFAHGHTYEAHPMTLAAGVAAIEEYKRLDIMKKIRGMAPHFASRLEEIRERHRSVGDVRHIGLFGAVELVKDQEKKTPFNSYEEKVAGKSLMTDLVAKKAMQDGVYISTWVTNLMIAPPLIISHDDLDRGFDALDAALSIADREVM